MSEPAVSLPSRKSWRCKDLRGNPVSCNNGKCIPITQKIPAFIQQPVNQSKNSFFLMQSRKK
jgi:hypothetical protein